MNLQKYVGRIVRLKKLAFEKIREQASHQGHAVENCFLVAEVSRGMRQLICYSANLRISIGASDIILV